MLDRQETISILMRVFACRKIVNLQTIMNNLKKTRNSKTRFLYDYHNYIIRFERTEFPL